MSENDNSDTEKQVHVVDRRRFDASGKERGDEPQPSVATKAEVDSSAAASAIRQEFKMEPGDEDHEEVSFTSFVMSLATQTMVQMGEMQPPPGMEIPVDVESARQTIDILAMLQRKTRGNLSTEEVRFMEEVLHTLRMSYVRRKQK
jgi:hypothetical protein